MKIADVTFFIILVFKTRGLPVVVLDATEALIASCTVSFQDDYRYLSAGLFLFFSLHILT
jgi:hypothetical protein